MDKFDDEAINYEEYLSFVEGLTKCLSHQNDLLQVFKVFDIDGDGQITSAELKQILHEHVDETLTDADIDEMIRVADLDGDGCVNFQGKHL